MPKVHKEAKQIPFCPVTSACGSLSAVLSTFIDSRLQGLIAFMPAYIKNAGSLIDKLKELLTLPAGAMLCTCNTVSIYTNIDTDEGVATIRKYLFLFKSECKQYAILMNRSVLI